MARNRTSIFALIMIAGAISLLVGSGAFSTVAAERTVTVQTAGDDSALLQLTVHSGANGAFAQQSGGELEILLNGASSSGDGVNLNASTTIADVFNITNQGTQSVGVWVTKSGPHSDLVTFENMSGSRLDNSSNNASTLGTGNTFEVTVVIDTTNQNLSDNETLLNSVTIHADANQA